MPTIDQSLNKDKEEFRGKMYQNFLSSDYWEAGMNAEKLYYRFSRYCCDVFYELIEEQKEAI